MNKIKKLDILKESVERETKLREGTPKGWEVMSQFPNTVEDKINEIIDRLNELVKDN